MSNLLTKRNVLIIAFLAIVVVVLFFVFRGDGGGGEGSTADLEVWTKQGGTIRRDFAKGITMDSQGNVIIGGYDGTGFIRKFDPEGVEIWHAPFGPGGSDTLPRAYRMAIDSEDNVFLADHYGNSAFLRKFDFDGKELWVQEWELSSRDRAWGVAVDDQGNAYVGGGTEGAFPGQTLGVSMDAYIRKFDPQGNEIWTRQFSSEKQAIDTGTSEDNIMEVAADSEGIYVGGTADGTIPGVPRNIRTFDAFIRKYDHDGNELWTSSVSTDREDDIMGIELDDSGMIYVVGNAGPLPGQELEALAPFVRKLDSNGTELWTRKFAGDAAGHTSSASLETTRAFGMGVNPLNGDVYAVGRVEGEFEGQTTARGRDAFVIKYTTDGDQEWVHQFGTSNADQANGVVIRGLDHLYVSGQTGGEFTDQTHYGLRDWTVRKLLQTQPIE